MKMFRTRLLTYAFLGSAYLLCQNVTTYAMPVHTTQTVIFQPQSSDNRMGIATSPAVGICLGITGNSFHFVIIGCEHLAGLICVSWFFRRGDAFVVAFCGCCPVDLVFGSMSILSPCYMYCGMRGGGTLSDPDSCQRLSVGLFRCSGV